MHGNAAVTKRRDEHVMLFRCALCPQHVVKEQAAYVLRGQPGQFEPRAVHDDLAELPDLRMHAESHDLASLA